MALAPEQTEREDCNHDNAAEHSIAVLQKALHNHHRLHARAKLGARLREVRKPTLKTPACNTTRQSTASPLCKKHFTITIEDMHAQFQARGLGKCQNGPLRQHLPLSALHRHTETTRGNTWRSSIVMKLCTHCTNTMQNTVVSGMAPVYVWAADRTSLPRSLPVHVRGACF